MNNDNAIRRLIRACVDDQRALQHESKFVDESRAATLTNFARERERFRVDLEQFGYVGQSRPKRSWVELVREASRELWVLACGRNNGDAIAVCRHSRARTEARYEAAMRLSWPAETSRVLDEQRRRLHEEARELNEIQF